MATPCSSNEATRAGRAASPCPPGRGGSGRPRILLNLAITADGKIATANRKVVSFGSRRDQEHLYELRATVDAVICGARTVLESQATLDAGPARFRALRRRRGLADQPLRVVVSGSAKVSPSAPLWRRRAGPVIVLSTCAAPADRLRRLNRLGACIGIFGQASLDLPAALGWLRQEWNIRRLLCEGGGRLNAALFRAGLVDELHLTLCPLIVGGAAAPTLADGPWPANLSEAITARLHSRRQHQDELFVVYRFTQPNSTRAPESPSSD